MKIKQKINKTRNLYYGAMAFVFVSIPSVSFAQTNLNAGGIADNLARQFGSFEKVLMGGAFLLGIFLGIKAILGFKKNSEDGGREGMGKPITYAILAFFAVSFGSFLAVGNTTFLNGQGQIGGTPGQGMNQGGFSN